MARSRFCDHSPALSRPLPPCTLMPTTTSPAWNSDFNCSTYTFSQPSSLVSALSKGMLSTKLIARSRGWFGTIVHLHRSAARWEAVPAERSEEHTSELQSRGHL